jgi:hypothetical protein
VRGAARCRARRASLKPYAQVYELSTLPLPSLSRAAVGNGEATAPGVKRPRPEGVAKAAGGPAKRPATGKAGGAKPAKARCVPCPPVSLSLACACASAHTPWRCLISRATQAAAPAGVQFIEQPVDGLLGRRIKRYWPEEGGWFEAVITNYNPENGEHCMMYDMGTPNETYAWERLSEVKKEEIVWVQGPLVPLSQIVEPLPLAQAPVVRPPVGGAARGGAQGRKAQTAGMPAVARDLENAVQRAKDVSKLDEVQLQVEARMRELQQKLAALEDSGPAVAAPAPQQLPPPQQQHVAEEAPVAEAAGAPAEGDEHETSVSGEDA